MGISKILKKNTTVYQMLLWIQNALFCTATLISPELNTRIRYRQAFGKRLDLQNPKTLNEKLLWLKLRCYGEDPLVIQCADKVGVRAYVESCGCDHVLNEIYGVYDGVTDIPWESLPDRFVLKWNFGAGMNIVCPDKTQLDVGKSIRQMCKWGKKKYWLSYSEMQYKYAPKKIICERYLKDDATDVLPDFKVYCFHGEPLAILVMHDRGKEIKTEFFDKNWNRLENTEMYRAPETTTERPLCLDEMLEVSRELSSSFPFVRCDYYIVNQKLYFGEMTFTPAGGIYTAQTKIEGKDMTEFLHIKE